MNEKQNIKPLMVDIKKLQEMTNLSKNNAMRLGNDAGAKVELGIRRTLYNVRAVEEYLDAHTEKYKRAGEARAKRAAEDKRLMDEKGAQSLTE